MAFSVSSSSSLGLSLANSTTLSCGRNCNHPFSALRHHAILHANGYFPLPQRLPSAGEISVFEPLLLRRLIVLAVMTMRKSKIHPLTALIGEIKICKLKGRDIK